MESRSPQTVTQMPGVARAVSVTVGTNTESPMDVARNCSDFSNAFSLAVYEASKVLSDFSKVSTGTSETAIESSAFERVSVPEDFSLSIFDLPCSSTRIVWLSAMERTSPLLLTTSTLPSFKEATVLPLTFPTKPTVPRMAAMAVDVLNLTSRFFCFWISKCTRPLVMSMIISFLESPSISAANKASVFSMTFSTEPSAKDKSASDSYPVLTRSFS